MTSQRILLCSHSDDAHALIVSAALQQLGHEAVFWNPEKYPESLGITVKISNNSFALTSCKPRLEMADGFDAIWLRRIRWSGRALAPKPRLMDVAARHSAFFIDRIFDLLPDTGRWVNRHQSAVRAEYKPSQLQKARNCGLRIPETVVSNEPSVIRDFLETRNGQVVAKPVQGEYVRNPDGTVSTIFAEILDARLAQRDRPLAAGPYVYQERIDAAFEIRVTVMGQKIFGARIERAPGEGVVDAHRNSIKKVTRCPVPSMIAANCLRLGEDFGLVFYCADFIVTPGGDWIFLEINQAGQFLWLEQHCPDEPYLAAFCALLLGETQQPDLSLDRALRDPGLRQLLTATAA